ncbi:MAG: SRPBCC domain-containing protein [Chloroflexota bacterium]
MIFFTATANIQASAETIWAILTDGERYPEWDPWADKIEGTIAPGETIKAFSKLSPGRAFPAKVTGFDVGKRMEWTGGMPLGLFKGVRSFVLKPEVDGTITFTLREEFTGLLLPLIGRTLPDMTQAFNDFARGLKGRAEGS